jgi:hypothetical protein
MAPETQKSIEQAIKQADTVALTTALLAAMEKISPLLGVTRGAMPSSPFGLDEVTGYQVKGDTATARAGAETLDFVRIDGRWYITPPTRAK